HTTSDDIHRVHNISSSQDNVHKSTCYMPISPNSSQGMGEGHKNQIFTSDHVKSNMPDIKLKRKERSPLTNENNDKKHKLGSPIMMESLNEYVHDTHENTAPDDNG
ncbi:unnamed protein product, partial [Owenia fusiformis]